MITALMIWPVGPLQETFDAMIALLQKAATEQNAAQLLMLWRHALTLSDSVGGHTPEQNTRQCFYQYLQDTGCYAQAVSYSHQCQSLWQQQHKKDDWQWLYGLSANQRPLTYVYLNMSGVMNHLAFLDKQAADQCIGKKPGRIVARNMDHLALMMVLCVMLSLGAFLLFYNGLSFALLAVLSATTSVYVQLHTLTQIPSKMGEIAQKRLAQEPEMQEKHDKLLNVCNNSPITPVAIATSLVPS